MKGPGDVYSRLPAGLCRARERNRFDTLVCVHWSGHDGHHRFTDPWTVCMRNEDKPRSFPMQGDHPCKRWQRRAVDTWLWSQRHTPALFWGFRVVGAVFCLWCVMVKMLENDLNHPHWKEWKGSPGSSYGPLCNWICRLTDGLTGGRCHD